jgi:hypothetical protein
MENENDYIDKLYSGKFEKFEVQSVDEDWTRLNSKLGKSNFLKFSFASFNVFYLAAFLSFAGTAGYLGVHSAAQSAKIDSLEKKIEVLIEKVEKQDDLLILTDSASIEEVEINTDENKTNFPIQNIEIQKTPVNSKEITLKNAPEISIKADTVDQKTDSSIINKSSVQKINKVKKTVFVKKDKVLITDTVRIKQNQK